MTNYKSITLARFATAFLAVFLFVTSPAFANHPVLVEGESDFDGDGLLRGDEDKDGDNVFGTIGGALDDATNRPEAFAGKKFLVFVTGPSGISRFHEQVIITEAHGDVTFEAAPGTSVHLDAFREGDPASAERQGIPGIIVRSGARNRVIFRNIAVRNFAYGMLIQGESHVVVENCRVEHNLNHNIRVMDTAVVAIHHSEVNAAGIRANSPTPPNPGNGITFEGWSTGVVADTLVSGSFGAGVSNQSNNPVRMIRSTAFDNKPDVEGRVPSN